MKLPSFEKGAHELFEVGVVLKGINGILELIGGTILAFIHTATINNFLDVLTQQELVEDPRDAIANYIKSHIIQNISPNSKLYAELFLLSHGIVKIILVAGLLKNKLWAYPAAIAVFSAFIFYQLYQLTYSHSVFLVLLTIFDIAVVALTAHEYKHARKRQSVIQ